MFKLKENLSPEVLRQYGFRLGSEFINERRFEYLSAAEAQEWFKFKMDEEEPEHIAYAESEFDYAMVEISCFLRSDNIWVLYIDCAPSCTYHIGGGDLDVITDTFYDLIIDGVIEKI